MITITHSQKNVAPLCGRLQNALKSLEKNPTPSRVARIVDLLVRSQYRKNGALAEALGVHPNSVRGWRSKEVRISEPNLVLLKNLAATQNTQRM